MRVVVIMAVSVSSILLAIMTHSVLNEISVREEELRTALSVSMEQTMHEIFESNSYGMNDRNEKIAAFLQSLLIKVNEDMDLTVSIYEFDEQEGVVDAEVTGGFMLPNHVKKEISVRRRMRVIKKAA